MRYQDPDGILANSIETKCLNEVCPTSLLLHVTLEEALSPSGEQLAGNLHAPLIVVRPRSPLSPTRLTADSEL